MMNARVPKKTSADQNGEFCNKKSPSVFLSVEFVCWLPYKSQVQNPGDWNPKLYKEMLLNNMLDFQSSLRFSQLLLVKILSGHGALRMVVSLWMKLFLELQLDVQRTDA